MSDDIQARLKRLRKAGRLRRRSKPRAPEAQPTKSAASPAPAHHAPADATDLSELPGMQEMGGEDGAYLLRTVRYPLTHRQGRSSLGDLLELSADAAAWLAQQPDFDFRNAVFLDTETSGLAGGAGTIVFLTGVGTFEKDAYVVRQYFARNPAEERAYLPDLAQFVAQRGGLITFNGRSFDWPLLRSRFILSGVQPPREQPHIDLLHPARRIWRQRLGACNFGNLERRVLAYQRSGQDIPSWMIPGLWFSFARGQGSVGEMAAVLYHNLEDIVSMVPLAHVIAATLTGAMPPHPQDLPALARTWQRAGRPADAENAYRRALDAPLPPSLRAQTLRDLALLLKRREQWDEAALYWQALADMNANEGLDALLELAKYHEWRTKDIEKARAYTDEAIARAETWTAGRRRQEMLAELAHRRQRLERKATGNQGS